MRTAFGRQLKALRAGLSASPDALPLTHLRPVFVPAAFMEAGNWPGPYELCDIPGLALTWAVLLPQQTMRYVSHETAAHWEANGTPWRERALQNLLLSAGEQPFTHELRRDDGSVYAVVMMHEDGLGPSRLLAAAILQTVLEGEYFVALPEMSCALALSVAASEAEQAKAAEIVDHCFVNGTRPLVPGFHKSSLLQPRSGV